jgi:hypothetical protein
VPRFVCFRGWQWLRGSDWAGDSGAVEKRSFWAVEWWWNRGVALGIDGAVDGNRVFFAGFGIAVLLLPGG